MVGVCCLDRMLLYNYLQSEIGTVTVKALENSNLILNILLMVNAFIWLHYFFAT